MIDLQKLRDIKHETERRVISLAGAAKDVAYGMSVCDHHEREDRKTKCGNCSYRKVRICSLCGCFITAKISIREFQCPLGAWTPERYADGEKPVFEQVSRFATPYFYQNGLVYAYEKQGDGVNEYETDPKTMVINLRMVTEDQFRQENSPQPPSKV